MDRGGEGEGEGEGEGDGGGDGGGEERKVLTEKPSTKRGTATVEYRVDR